jgi:hypothetical protein
MEALVYASNTPPTCLPHASLLQAYILASSICLEEEGALEDGGKQPADGGRECREFAAEVSGQGAEAGELSRQGAE